MCSEEIARLRAQNVLTVLGSTVNITWGNLYDHLTRNFTLIIDKIFIQAPKIVKKVATSSIWICEPSLY
jgi:hypothetical protein